MSKANKQTISKQLAKCPFCGGEIKLDEYDFYMFCCDECGAGVTFAKSLEDGTAEECTKEESIEKWNTRKPMQNIVERLEEENYIKDGGELFLNHNLEDCIPMRRVYEIIKEEGGA